MQIKNKIRDVLISFAPVRELLFFVFQKKVYKRHIDKKITAFLNGNRKLSEKRIDNLIVSLTSFPQRISEVKYTIYSLLIQSVLPEKIILWLAESQFPNREQDLPKELLTFRTFGFVINWCEDLKSYKKLIPALELYHDYYIVTADDDIYYRRRWLEKLWLEHLKFPNDIICHTAYRMRFKDKNVLPYVLWEKDIKGCDASFQTLGIGSGGILYHKKYLYKDIGKNDLFLKLTPNADDIWFYFMAILNGTKIRVVKNPSNKVKYVNPYLEYGLSNGYRLSSINVDNGLNDRQFKNVIDYYNIDLYSLLKEPFNGIRRLLCVF
jgi:hypothetical protein